MPRRVLLIDDNLAVQKLVELTLRKEGYDVTSIDNGLSALDLAFKNQPDLILADFNLEGINIYTFVQKIRQRGSLLEIPIVLLINSTESYDPAQLQSAGIQAFLKKPIDSRELIQEVKRQTGASETVMMDLGAVQKKEEPSLAEHFSNSGNEAVKIEELLGWSSPGSLTEEAQAKIEAEQTILEPPPPPSDVDSNSASQEMGEETQFFTDSAALQPVSAPAESAEASRAESLEETHYFQESTPSPPPPPMEEPAPLELEESLPGIFPEPSLADPMQEASIQPNPLEEREAPISPASDAAPPLPDAHPIPPPAPPLPLDPSQINKALQKNIAEIVEKVVWEVLPGMLQSSMKSELKEIIEKVTWEVIPPLAEIEIKKEIKRLQEEDH
ncbi:MAG: response regulator [Candidatus Manganitrophaceae bacterium]|nr:MAG: response regulator [Candidatus Manganitrophaceae bacterium]